MESSFKKVAAQYFENCTAFTKNISLFDKQFKKTKTVKDALAVREADLAKRESALTAREAELANQGKSTSASSAELAAREAELKKREAGLLERWVALTQPHERGREAEQRVDGSIEDRKSVV